MSAPNGAGPRFPGVCVGIVTNTNDPLGMGRVKLVLPWLSADVETGWARTAAPMAGPERGVYFPPEVDDEVLVAFEQGDPAFPYVLGGLWNGKDLPPEPADEGRGDRRTIRSRSGHVVRFVDEDGKEKIEIVDGGTKNRIEISTADNTITIAAEGDVTITAGGKLILSGTTVEIN